MIVYVANGSLAGRKIFLPLGRVAQFGRTEWADFAFPHDAQMAPVHFSIRHAADGCRLLSLAGPPGLLLNGEAVAEAMLTDGDEITAGSTVFRVEQTGAKPSAAVDRPAGQETQSADPTAGGFNGGAISDAKQLAAYLGLDSAAKKLALEGQSPQELLDELSRPGLFPAAVRVMAHLLPKRAAVWWSWLCVGRVCQSTFDRKGEDAMRIARSWVAEPSDERGWAAFNAAQAAGLDSPAAWPALSAFWCGSSLAAPDYPAVTPDERLAGKGVTAALLLAIGGVHPLEVDDCYQSLLQLGATLAIEPVEWPSPDKPEA